MSREFDLREGFDTSMREIFGVEEGDKFAEFAEAVLGHRLQALCDQELVTLGHGREAVVGARREGGFDDGGGRYARKKEG